MQTFKRTPMNIVKNTAYTVGTPVVVALVAYIIMSSFTAWSSELIYMISGAIGFVIAAYFIYSLLVSQAVRIELDDKEMRYYQKNKLKHTLALDAHSFGYRQQSQGSTTDTIDLIVKNNETGKEFTLDCEPLGSRQFGKLFDLLEQKEPRKPAVRLEVE